MLRRVLRVGEVPLGARRDYGHVRAGVLLRVDGLRGDEAAAAPQTPIRVAGRRAELGKVHFVRCVCFTLVVLLLVFVTHLLMLLFQCERK